MPKTLTPRKEAFASAAFSIPGLEDPNLFASLRADAIAVYQPVNSQELLAVERIALAQISLARAARLEAAIFTAALAEAAADGASTGDLCEGFQRLTGKSGALTLFLRYQAQSERNYRRAIEEFKRLKNLRKELPNELVDAPEPPRPQPSAAAAPARAATPSTPPASPRPADPAPAPRPLVSVASPVAAANGSFTVRR